MCICGSNHGPTVPPPHGSPIDPHMVAHPSPSRSKRLCAPHADSLQHRPTSIAHLDHLPWLLLLPRQHVLVSVALHLQLTRANVVFRVVVVRVCMLVAWHRGRDLIPVHRRRRRLTRPPLAQENAASNPEERNHCSGNADADANLGSVREAARTRVSGGGFRGCCCRGCRCGATGCLGHCGR